MGEVHYKSTKGQRQSYYCFVASFSFWALIQQLLHLLSHMEHLTLFKNEVDYSVVNRGGVTKKGRLLGTDCQEKLNKGFGGDEAIGALTLCSLSAHICAERFMPKCA